MIKILSVGNFSGPSWDGSAPDEEHIASALEELGHEVYRLQRESLDDIQLLPWEPDFTLIAQWDGYKDVSKLHKPLVYWAFDYQAEGQEWHERLIKEADLYLSKRIADSKYDNWQWLAQDFAPSFLDKWEEPISVEKYERAPFKKDIDVLFTGSYLDWATERNETIQAVNNNFNLVVHSVNDWPFLKRQPPVMDHGLPALYARAKVVLSIDHTIESGYWSDRPAQAMACGAFVLHRYQPLSEARFHDNLGYFRDVESCLNQIESWLRIDKGRQTKAEQGYEYAQQYLKVSNRVNDLINIVWNIL